MKHLRIEVNGQEWVNGDFAEVSFTDGPTGVRVEGKTASPTGGGGPSLLDLLTNASRSRTAEVVEQKREAAAEPVTVPAPTVVEDEPVEIIQP